jgi:hypothetical protein
MRFKESFNTLFGQILGDMIYSVFDIGKGNESYIEEK